MPILANAKKALRASNRKAVINSRTKSKMRTAIKAAQADPSKENIKAAYSAVDRAAKNKLIHKNKAAHVKSQLASKKPASK